MKGKFRSRGFLILASFIALFLVWPGSPSPLAAQEIEVDSADPPSAEQGTINLDVVIRGKGFDRSANAKFFLTGTTNPGGVTVNSTRFVNPRELVANIDVAEDAVIDKFDIEVQARKGRTGKGTELFSVVAKGKGQSQETLVRATFRDFADDRIQSDLKALPYDCSADYVDFDDPCGPGDLGVVSHVSQAGYLLRTVNLWDPDPKRWLVFDFRDGVDGSECQNLDVQLLNYSGRNPDAVSPHDPDCGIDLLEVRFRPYNAFTPGAEYTMLAITIDGPDWIPGRGKKKEGRHQWNAKYYLNFVNPLTITHDPTDPNKVILTTIDGLEQAELWTVNQKTGDFEELLGKYWMPLEVTLTRLP